MCFLANSCALICSCVNPSLSFIISIDSSTEGVSITTGALPLLPLLLPLLPVRGGGVFFGLPVRGGGVFLILGGVCKTLVPPISPAEFLERLLGLLVVEPLLFPAFVPILPTPLLYIVLRFHSISPILIALLITINAAQIIMNITITPPLNKLL